MILPIYAYGHKVLKTVAKDIDQDYPELDKLIDDMWETMYNAKGIGLAAPQIGRSIRLFLVDSEQLGDEFEGDKIKEVFINAQILQEDGAEVSYEEGCLSIPDIRGDVMRPPHISIEYFDQNFNKHTKSFEGMTARIIQHEYDHIDGILFTELLPPLRKRLLKRKLESIRKGKARADYKMRFAPIK